MGDAPQQTAQQQTAPLPVPVALGLAAALVVVALASVAVQRCDAGRMPDDAAVALVNQQIRDAAGEHDLVRTLPLWFNGGRVGLGELPVLLSRDPDLWDIALAEHVWVAWSASHERLARRELAQLRDVEVLVSDGPFRLARARSPEARPAWDAYDAARDAVVRLVAHQGAEQRSCARWIDGGWHCGSYNAWVNLTPGIREMDETPRRTLMTAPPEPHLYLSAAWSDVPIRDVIEMRAGNGFTGVRSARGSATVVQLLLDGEVVVERAFPPQERGYPLMRVDTNARTGQTAQLEVRVYADDPLDRAFGFRVRSVSRGEPPL